MDLNEYWQENKRFVMLVAGGLLAFLTGEMLISSLIGDDVRATQSALVRRQGELREERFSTADLDRAREQNEALKQALETLRAGVDFEPRPDYVVAAQAASPTQYFSRVTAVRDELLREAGRLDVRLPEDLGLPALAPTKPAELERHLEALDLIERVVRLAFQHGVPRVERITIRLDPGLGSRKGTGPVERTQVEMRLSGPSDSLVRLLAATQDGKGQPLLVGELEMVPERTKTDEARLDVTFLVARLKGADVVEN